MTVSTVHPHFHRWIFLKTILHDFKKVRVLRITKELATFVFCSSSQPCPEFRECNTKRKRKRELNGLLFLKKREKPTKTCFLFPLCQMKALQRWLSSWMLLFESCRTWSCVALLSVHQRTLVLLKVKTTLWCVGDLCEGIRSLGEEYLTLLTVRACFKEICFHASLPICHRRRRPKAFGNG